MLIKLNKFPYAISVEGQEFRFAFIPKANLKQTWARIERNRPTNTKRKSQKTARLPSNDLD